MQVLHKHIMKIKRVFYALVFLLLANNHDIKAQSPFHTVDSQLRVMYAGLCRDTLGPKFLYQQAVHTLDSNFFTEFNPDTLIRDYWFTIYEELRRCAYNNSFMLPMDTVLFRSFQWQSDTVNMNFLAYQMNTIVDSLLDADYFNIDTVNNTISDISPCEFDPYFNQKVFAASPVELNLPSLNPTFRIDTQFFFYDQWNDIFANNWNLQIDYDDGTGWHTYTPGALMMVNYYSPTYTSGGYKYFKYRIVDAFMVVKMSCIAKAYVGSAQKKLPPADHEIAFPGINVGEYYPCDESGEPYKKIVFYLEGIDLGDWFPSSNRNHREIYDLMIEGKDIDKLRNFGYTIVVCDWMNSRQDIKINAAIFEAMLDYYKCKQMTIDDTGTHEQFVIIGESMGGLVARYALCEMEDLASTSSLSGCLPEKIHNTRLLITFDTPHEGANIPLAYQHVFRDFGNLIGANNASQILSGSILNMWLDATAAKQMLLYHVDTKSGNSYSEHSERTTFKSDLAAIGNYPQYCKLMAMSHGTFRGIGQTHFYDTLERTAGDYLLKYNSDVYAKLFANVFQVLGTRIELHTTANGVGNLVDVTRDTYHPKIKMGIKIKWRPWPWPPKITAEPKITSVLTSSASIKHDGDTEPYDVIPGGYQNYNGSLLNDDNSVRGFPNAIFFGPNSPNYNPVSHTWTLDETHYVGNFGGGVSSSMYTDGMHFCFIPTFSAISYDLPSNDYYYDIQMDNATNNMSRTPFDVITGYTEFYNSPIYNRNQQHLAVRNLELGSYRNGVLIGGGYRDTCLNSNIRIQKLINREIGEDTIHVENRTTNWTCIYDAEEQVTVNMRSPYYAYPTGTGSIFIFPGTFSKENPYTISSGITHFATNNSSTNVLGTGSLPSGTWVIEDINWERCCGDSTIGFKNGETSSVKNLRVENLKVYPNPVVNGEVIFEFTAQKSSQNSIQIFDMTGRKILQNTFDVKNDSAAFKVQIDLGRNLSSGIYMITLRNGDKIYNSKLTVQ